MIASTTFKENYFWTSTYAYLKVKNSSTLDEKLIKGQHRNSTYFPCFCSDEKKESIKAAFLY